MEKQGTGEKLRRKLIGFTEKTGEMPFFIAVQRSLALTLPLIMVGALALMARDFPLPQYQQWMRAVCGPAGCGLLDRFIDGSFGVAALAVLCAYAGVMTGLHNQRHPGHSLSPVMTLVVVLSCHAVLTGNETALLSLDRGLFLSLIIAAAATRLYLFLALRRSLRLPLTAVGGDHVIGDVLVFMPAGILTLLTFGLIRLLLPPDTALIFQDLVAGALTRPGYDYGLGMALLYSALCQIFWFLGIHGPNLLFPIEASWLLPASVANTVASTLDAPALHIFTKPFFDAFTRMGGSGSTLCLVFAVFLASSNKSDRKLCAFALFPALCNVNEPLLFGLPLVFNPVYMIPFLLTPVMQTLSAWAATTLDLVPHTLAGMSWTTPVFVSGITATGSIKGALLQAVNLALGVALYLPFVRLSCLVRERQAQRLLQGLMHSLTSPLPTSHGHRCLDRPGGEGRLAKMLAHDLEQALEENTQLFLEYQPQMDAVRNHVHGVEALLRWRHPIHGMIPPPLTVALAEDIGCDDRLTSFVLEEACAQRAAWTGQVPENLLLSVNVSPQQLACPHLPHNLSRVLDQTGLSPHLLELEITESSVLELNAPTVSALLKLRQIGTRVAIDDFGMGHTSLRYLQELQIHTIKIDRSLTLKSQGSVNSEIIRSMMGLGENLHILTVVEGVEEPEQLAHFLELGCRIFQGYLFSRPLSGEACLHFIRKHYADRAQ